ncbi:BspA family leucine-rich repeat surface protein [Catellicoccus marimammalium]|uniref:BspA family leucine-rich repeat surface protein n=1 Tax=Catellicoccus marimammalium M35/04/3 TaxID=1234409 RepID=K8Z7Z1_9ENTE|nr:BspA family leucine-rich repeat surface protein [Catellicoccus marimammalium]EKU26980.1 hypothetical protein C683_0976 [Catellicoccus marimammalium M35/04/3]
MQNSKLKESTTPKNGTVYQVDGYRNIDGKHVYRVYQTDKDGKKAYRGYIDRKDTKDFNAEKAEGQFVLNGKANVWKNFYWTAKNTDNAERVVFAKYEYTLGNGQKYYSVYSKDAEGKEVWQGYTSKSNLKEVTSTKESKYVTLKKNTKSFANLYFQQTKDSFDASKGVNFKVTRYYTIDGKKYYSTEQSKEAWTGYVDSSVVEDLTAKKVAAADSKVKVAKEWNTYSDHFYTKKAKLADYKGKDLTAKYVYTYGNGKKYASLYDGDTWVGYANVEALDVVTEDKPTNPEKPEVKPEQSELEKAKKAAEEAIKKAEAELAKSNASKESKEAAQKVIDAAKETVKGDNLDAIKKIPAQLDEAIKALQPADVKALEDAIKRAESLVGTPGLTGTDEVKAKLDVAKKVLEEAKKGAASKEDIKKATDELEKAIAGVKLDTTNLKDALEATKQLAKDYYLTKDQEAKLNKVFDEIQKVVDDAKTDKKAVDAAKAKLDKIADALKVQPTYTQGQALSEAIAKANKLKAHEEAAKVLFEDFNGLKVAYKEATDTMTELKKDPQAFGATNTATKEMTAQQVEEVAKKLNDALDNLKINAENTKAFYDEAKKAIDKLATENQTDPKAKLDAFAEAAKKGTAKDINEILDTAKALVNAIDAAQNKELEEAIDKAERIIKENDAAKEGNQGTDEDFYTADTFNKLKEELKKAQEAIQLTPATITKETAHNKANSKDALDKAINDLQINHWDSEVKDGKVVLTKYKPLAIDESQKEKNGIIYRKDKIVIPGKLKDMPVELNIKYQDPSTYLNPIIDDTDLKEKVVVNAQQVPVTFKEVDGQKVTTGDKLWGTFSYMGTIDVSGLDTSNTTSFFKTFCANTSESIKGIENLNTSKATDFSSMFSDAKSLTTLDLSKWNTDNVGKITSMFFDTPKLTHLDLSGWTLPKVPNNCPQSKVFGDKNTLSGVGTAPKYNSFCGVIRYPDMDKDAKDNNLNKAPVWIDGLIFPTNERAKHIIEMDLDDSITGTMDHTKPKK